MPPPQISKTPAACCSARACWACWAMVLAAYRLVALVVALSIVAHSSTDVVLARWIQGSRQGSSGEQAAAAE